MELGPSCIRGIRCRFLGIVQGFAADLQIRDLTQRTKGYRLVGLKMVTPTLEMAQNHYKDLSKKPFFGGLSQSCYLFASLWFMRLITLFPLFRKTYSQVLLLRSHRLHVLGGQGCDQAGSPHASTLLPPSTLPTHPSSLFLSFFGIASITFSYQI